MKTTADAEFIQRFSYIFFCIQISRVEISILSNNIELIYDITYYNILVVLHGVDHVNLEILKKKKQILIKET